MTQPPPNAGITLTQPLRWVWHISLNGKRVGTVNGHDLVDFIDRHIDHESIGDYISVEAARQAWTPDTDRRL